MLKTSKLLCLHSALEQARNDGLITAEEYKTKLNKIKTAFKQYVDNDLTDIQNALEVK